MKPNALLVGLFLLSACSAPSNQPVVGPSDAIVVRFQISGGIAGMTFVDVDIRSDGTVEDSVSESVGRVDGERLEQLVRDLGRLDICDLDSEPIDDGPSRLADGTATVIEISCENGLVTHSAYGLGEVPDSFDPRVVSASELIRDFVVETNAIN